MRYSEYEEVDHEDINFLDAAVAAEESKDEHLLREPIVAASVRTVEISLDEKPLT